MIGSKDELVLMTTIQLLHPKKKMEGLKGQKSNKSITKHIPKEKYLNDIGLRICNFGSKMLKNCPLEKGRFWLFATQC